MQFANNVNIFQKNLISAYGQNSPRYRQENIGGGINLIYVVVSFYRVNYEPLS